MPKVPGYVKMVESQRDLLLRAVQEMQQRNGGTSATPADINEILRELNTQNLIPNDHSSFLSRGVSIPQTPPSAPPNSELNPETPNFESKDLGKTSWVEMASAESPSPSTNPNVIAYAETCFAEMA